MLESPRMVRTPGISALMRRIASIVSMPSRRDSTMPVESGSASAAMKMSAAFLRPARPRLDHAGRERQRECVDEDVRGVEAVALDGELGDVARGADLPLRGTRLALLIDAGRHDRRAELGREGEEAVESGPGPVALFEVHRVEDRLAAEPRQRLARDLGLGRVDHDRHRGLRSETTHHLVHVAHAVGAGVVDADVEDVGTLLDLVASDAHAGVPVALEHRLAELLRTVGVRALADQETRTVLLVGVG